MPSRLDVMRVAVVSVCLASCAVNLTAPTDVEITCSGNAECPSGYHCSTQLSRCVPDGQEDVPPKIQGLAATVERVINAATVEVDAAAVGATVRVRFTVDEALSDPPVVTLSWPDSDGYQRQAQATLSGGVYEMDTTIDALDPAGAVSIGVVAIDLVGNVGNAELPRHFIVDTTPFLLSSAALRPLSPVPTELSAIGVVVTAARNEAPGVPEIVAQLNFNKAPRQKPIVSLAAQSGAVVPGVVSALAATTFVVTFEIPESLTTSVNGDPFDLVVNAHDDAGNAWDPDAGVSVPSIIVDTSPPTAPTNLRFLRAPWGAGNAVPERMFAVEATTAGALVGTAGATQPDLLFVHDAPSGTRARLGVVQLSSAGTLPGDQLVLATSDRLDVVARLVDAAGNEGAPLRVTDGRWVATFKDRSTGDDFLNPNRLTRVSEASDALFDHLASEASTADIVKTVLADDVSFLHSVRSGLWRFRRLGTPPPQELGGAAYVPAAGRVQLIGGLSADSIFSNIWDWDGEDWRTTDFIGLLWPGESIGPSFAHDFARNRSIFHGGTVTLEPQQKTWEFDGTNWNDVTPTPPGPPAVFATMVFDPVAGVMVLFGAFEDPVAGLCADGQTPSGGLTKCMSTTTWLFDGTTWEAVPCPTGGCPPARTFASMSYDPESGHVLLFGGTDAVFGGTNLFGDFWEWDTASRTWTEIPQSDPTWPSPRSGAIMSYVAGFGGVLIWGGCETGGEVFDCSRDGNPDNIDQYLVWQGSAATPPFATVTVDPVNGAPLKSRGIASSAYIPARDELLVFGGVRELSTGETSNACLTNHAGACDGENPRSSGSSGSERCVCDFTTGWTLEPTGATTARWRNAAATSSVFSPSERFTLVYADQAHRSVIFGGRINASGVGDCDGGLDNDSSDRCHSLWTWDGTSVRPGQLTASGNIANYAACGNATNPSACGQMDQPGTYLPGEGMVAFFERPNGTGGPGSTNSGIWRYDINGNLPVEPPVAVAAASSVPPDTQAYAIATTVDGVPDVIFLFGGVASGSCSTLDTRYGMTGVESYGTELGNNQCLSRALWRWAQASGWQLFLPAVGDDNWPSPRSYTTMVTIDGGAILLYGGCLQTLNGDCVATGAGDVTNGDTWVLTPTGGPTWACLSGQSTACPAPGPSDPGPLTGAKTAWDNDAHRVLMFGGSPQGEGPGPNTLWTWRQTQGAPLIQGAWNEIVVDGARPLSRKRHGLIYDKDRRVLVLAGEGRAGEIWEINLDTHNRPVLVFDFALRAAGLFEAPGVQKTRDTVQRIWLYLDVVASGFDGPATLDTLFIQLWNSPLGHWSDVGTPTGPGSPTFGTCDYDADAARPGRQVVCQLSGDEARAMVFAGDDHIYARMAPAGGVGPAGEASTLALDAVRLEVDYTLPP